MLCQQPCFIAPFVYQHLQYCWKTFLPHNACHLALSIYPMSFLFFYPPLLCIPILVNCSFKVFNGCCLWKLSIVFLTVLLFHSQLSCATIWYQMFSFSFTQFETPSFQTSFKCILQSTTCLQEIKGSYYNYSTMTFITLCSLM